MPIHQTNHYYYYYYYYYYQYYYYQYYYYYYLYNYPLLSFLISLVPFKTDAVPSLMMKKEEAGSPSNTIF